MGRQLTVRVPLRIEPRHPRMLASSRMGSTPPSAGRMGITMMIFYTWNLSNPTDFSTATLRSSTFLRGYNWPIWKTALLARIARDPARIAANEIIESGSGPGTVEFRGLAIFDVCAMCDQAFIRVGAPLAHVQQIQARSTIGTKVGMLFFNFESYNQGVAYTAGEEGLRQISKQYTINTPTGGCDGLGANGYGAHFIDKYETSNLVNYPTTQPCTPGATWNPAGCISVGGDASVNTVHTRESFVDDPDYHEAMVVQLTGTFDPPYKPSGSLVYAAQLWDNARDRASKENASNDFQPHYDYVAGTKTFIGQLRLAYQSSPSDFLWFNHGELGVGGDAYTALEIPNRFVEFYFWTPGDTSDRSLASILAGIQADFDGGVRVIMGMLGGFHSQEEWATGPGPGGLRGTWAEIATKIRALDAWNRFFAQAGRSTSGGYICWQPEWRELV